MRKRLFCLFLVLALLLGAVPVRADSGPVIRCSDNTAPQGHWVSFQIDADALEDLAALELWLHYDPQVLRLESVSNGGLLDDAFASTNDTTPGRICLTAASVSGISGSGTLLYLYFSVIEDCAPGRYPLVLAVGEAYDIARSPVSIAAKNGHITVTEGTPSYTQFMLGMEPDRNTLSPGERFTVRVRNDWYLSFASFDLSVHYDATMFRLVNASISEDFDRPNTLCSLNTGTDGLVRLTCASVEPIWTYQLLELELEAKEGAMGTTALTAQIQDVYDSSRFPYLPGSVQTQLTVTPSESEQIPRLRLVGPAPVAGEQTLSTLTLDAGSGLAAADFELRYDPTLLECMAVEPAAEAQFLLINPNFADGTIRFSFVEEDGITDETPLVNIRWRARSGADRHYSIEMQLIDPVGADLRPVAVDCSPQTGCIYHRKVTAPTCEAPGGEQLHCVYCGDLVPVAPLPPLGHDYGDAVFHWADDYASCTATRVCARDAAHVWQVNCTVTHVSTGESCTSPGSVTYTATADFYGETYTDTRVIHMDMLGHDYDWTVITEPGCDSEGRKRGRCIRCDATCEEPIAPLGHDYQSQVTEPGCTEGGYTTHTCTRCADTYRDSHTEPTGHHHEWFVMVAPTCTEDGLEEGKCRGCGEVLSRTIPALGHDWSGTSCRRCGEFRANPFTDVPEGSFYYEPVIWSVANGITTGATSTTFDPNGSCMRAHVVTFLWRAAGQPEPIRSSNPFLDVKEKDFYYKAVLWAVENGITNGLDSTHFGPFAYCNRAQVVTFLWRANSNPRPTSSRNPFNDVVKGSFYYDAVLWAVEKGITNGMTSKTFGVGSVCNRAQVVTFLYRCFAQ